MVQNKRIEYYDFTHKDVKITVKIDYYNNKISLMQEDSQYSFQHKKWIFADRGVEYMPAWLNILEAMQEAIKDAKKKYEANLAEISKFKDEKIANLVLSMERSGGSLTPKNHAKR